jgi:hypothetical protein
MSEQRPGWGYNNEFRIARTMVPYEYFWDECQRLIDGAAKANPGASIVLMSNRSGQSLGGQMPADWNGQRVTVTI